MSSSHNTGAGEVPSMGDIERFDFKADRDRWRHEYRIEKQKNALLTHDRRELQDEVRSLTQQLKGAVFTEREKDIIYDALENYAPGENSTITEFEVEALIEKLIPTSGGR